MSSNAEFEQAAADVKKLKTTPSNQELLKLYGLYKQGTGEDFSAAVEPTGVMNFNAKYKYKAWAEVKDVPVEEAQKQYIQLVNELKEKYGMQEEK